jgi:hypothetical protein
VLAEADDRDERRVRALSQRLSTAIEQGATSDRLQGLTRAAFGIDEPDNAVLAAEEVLDEADDRLGRAEDPT